jgi:hypothetical protein
MCLTPTHLGERDRPLKPFQMGALQLIEWALFRRGQESKRLIGRPSDKLHTRG